MVGGDLGNELSAVTQKAINTQKNPGVYNERGRRAGEGKTEREGERERERERERK